MRGECNHDTCAIDTMAESLIVIAIAGLKSGRTRERLYRSLRDIDPVRIEAATASLIAVGLLRHQGGRIIQTPALERIDRLDMISI